VGTDADELAGFSKVQSQSLRVYFDRSHFHAMFSRVSHDLRWRIKSHRLAVEQRAAEGRRVIPFDPRAGINKQRE
jgi:hypothetical protein